MKLSMQNFTCKCEQLLFFGNVECVACHSQAAMCPSCRCVSAIEPAGKDQFRCQNCEQLLRLCENYILHSVCSRAIEAESSQTLCSYCVLNQVIPNLSIDGNLEKWRRIEAAKHRVLYDIERIGIPVSDEDTGGNPSLRFEFKSSQTEPVSTGHEHGLITLNILEADSVHRERTRIEFGEPQRTLVGHIRHELGHYYWDLIVQPHWIADFRKLFGDERNPDYATAQATILCQWSSAELAGAIHFPLCGDASVGGFCRDIRCLSRHDRCHQHSPPL